MSRAWYRITQANILSSLLVEIFHHVSNLVIVILCNLEYYTHLNLGTNYTNDSTHVPELFYDGLILEKHEKDRTVNQNKATIKPLQ